MGASETMAIAPESNVGNCPVCGNVITSYHCNPRSVYEFGPCGCRSRTWKVKDMKFVGKSSQDIPPTTDNKTLAEIESMLRNISQRCGQAATIEWAKTEIDRVANLLRTWQQ